MEPSSLRRIHGRRVTEFLVGVVATVTLHPWLWRAFGFRRAPKRGAFFNRFVPRERLARETFLVCEFWILGTERVFRATRVAQLVGSRAEILARMLELLVEGDPRSGPIYRALGFSSASDCAAYQVEGLRAYLSTDPRQRLALFLRRAADRTDAAHEGGWIVGAARIFASGDSPLAWVNLSVCEWLAGRSVMAHPESVHPTSLQLVKSLLGTEQPSPEAE